MSRDSGLVSDGAVRIAVWQTESADLGRLRERAREAAGAGAVLLVTPEAFTTGYAVPGVGSAAQPNEGEDRKSVV